MQRKKTTLLLIVIIAVIIWASGCVDKNSNVAPRNDVSSDTDFGTTIDTTPAQDENLPTERKIISQISDPSDNWKKDIIDWNGNKVPNENIIDVGFLPPLNPGEEPTHLIRKGKFDIRIEFDHTLKTEFSRIPDILQERTMVRVRIYDNKGLIKTKGINGEYLEYAETMAGHNLPPLEGDFVDRPIEDYKGMDVIVYSTKPFREVTPGKTIEI